MFSPVLIEIHLYAGERKRRLRLGAGKLCSRWTKDPVVTGPRSRFSLGVVAPIPYAVDSPLLDRGELTSDSIASIREGLASKATPLTHNG
jgi:hypothetical protein